jgi:glycosyltransferase involved in cell wall biosynthesis
MNVHIIGAVGIPAKYGGFETLAENLTDRSAQSHEFSVYCSTKAHLRNLKRHNSARLIRVPLQANGIQSIPYDILSMLHASRKADVLLILGVSGCSFLPVFRLFFRRKIIVNIDGLEWKRAKWSGPARSFLKYSEKMAVRHADVVVADSHVLVEYVRKEYGKEAVFIPYGGDHAKKVPIADETREIFPFVNSPYAFKVCRIEPENNVRLILEAFRGCSGLTLAVAGNWQTSAYGRGLRREFENCQNIFMLDPIYEQNLLNQLRGNCVLYVHGHSAGGTNPSLVEAMHLGLPIAAYDVNYNRETTNHQALNFSDTAGLKSIIEDLNTEQMDRVGVAMAAYARKHYTWDIVSQAYADLFDQGG